MKINNKGNGNSGIEIKFDSLDESVEAFKNFSNAIRSFGVSASQMSEQLFQIQRPLTTIGFPFAESSFSSAGILESVYRQGELVAKCIDAELNDASLFHSGHFDLCVRSDKNSIRPYLEISKEAILNGVAVQSYISVAILFVHSTQRTPRRILKAITTQNMRERLRKYFASLNSTEKAAITRDRFVDAQSDIGLSILNLYMLALLVQERVEDTGLRMRAFTSATIAIRGSLHPAALALNPRILSRWLSIRDMKCGKHEALFALSQYASDLGGSSISRRRLELLNDILRSFCEESTDLNRENKPAPANDGRSL